MTLIISMAYEWSKAYGYLASIYLFFWALTSSWNSGVCARLESCSGYMAGEGHINNASSWDAMPFIWVKLRYCHWGESLPLRNSSMSFHLSLITPRINMTPVFWLLHTSMFRFYHQCCLQEIPHDNWSSLEQRGMWLPMIILWLPGSRDSFVMFARPLFEPSRPNAYYQSMVSRCRCLQPTFVQYCASKKRHCECIPEQLTTRRRPPRLLQFNERCAIIGSSLTGFLLICSAH